MISVKSRPGVFSKAAAVSLLEVIIAFLILLIAILTMVGYTAMIHRSASESKHQAQASMEARSLLERVRDFPPLFEQALNDPDGYQETKIEYLLDDEDDPTKNEVGRKAAATFRLQARVFPITDEMYRIVVTGVWDDDGRQRRVTLESRTLLVR